MILKEPLSMCLWDETKCFKTLLDNFKKWFGLYLNIIYLLCTYIVRTRQKVLSYSSVYMSFRHTNMDIIALGGDQDVSKCIRDNNVHMK